MTIEDISERYKDIPKAIDSLIEMAEPNASIKVFEGNFLITDGTNDIQINGEIYFEWFPNFEVHFSGVTQMNISKLFNFTDDKISIIVNDLEFGKGFLTKKNFNNFNDEMQIGGCISGQAILGDKSICVKKLLFSIPNLRSFHGLLTQRIQGENIFNSRSRLVFENEYYIITLDKVQNYKEISESLESKGGYALLYCGELTSKKEAISVDNIRGTLHSLGTFFSFLNGRRTSALFIHGVSDSESIWCDYSSYVIDPYKYVQTWPQKHSIDGLDKLWQKFSKIWGNTENKDFLVAVVHWYVESNNHSGYTEGSLIMAQTALELLYNWLIIEEKKIIVGKDSESISASNKIRLLLSQLNISYLVPESFTHLKAFVNESKKEIVDAPDAVVQIRNAIVHSQVEKRKKLKKIHDMAKYEALQLCIWYIEMTLLYILEFEGKYNNRCSKELFESKAEEYVPWIKN